ncbi:acyl-ACP--UDP-N-acetylglucosamine O-acyltransferase [Caldimonas brevitalea]|uniref:Acyl-[acyl-carrier-protein]--UDP-N-acetylglucosamine O-acyltransferase n=1 Tax=Caldimonas brevitalea TaxID=413882 RepID=A0A0G3BI30_9BURK|nr:acyl-ACP--UDP-N-acetylglucosamine O-acyltransferase [Caldimonas brevitalea]AKJ29012.1 UDP-N-acetylglucosamine acyltransferase [Caldimonas brevitalea]
MAIIHPTAVVDPKAELAASVTVGAYAVIGPDVRIDEGTSVAPHVVIEGHTSIGRDNRIFQFCSVGAVPQDKKYAGEPTELRIGDRNVFREGCTLNVGTVQDGGVTSIGDDNWIMAYVHVAHDCHLGNRITIANGTQLGGHVVVGDWVTLGGMSGVHQFVKIGAHAMTAVGSVVLQDLPPFVMADGDSAEASGINAEGLRRRGFSAQRISAVKQMYRLLYRQGLTFEDAKSQISALTAEYPEASGDIEMMSRFLAESTRGIVR